MLKKGVIIIGGDFQGLGIARNLAAEEIPSIIIDPDFCIGRFSKFVQKCYRCPSLTKTKAFVSFLKWLAIEKKLRGWVIYPTTDSAVYILSRFKKYLAKYFLIPIPEWELAKYAYDKKLTYRLSQRLDIPAPKTLFPNNIEELTQMSVDFPVILKPIVKGEFFSVTKRKAIQANDINELIKNYRYMTSIIDRSQIMIQQLITGGTSNLYSFCSLFGNGEVKAKIMARRIRQHPMDFGNASTFAITCEIPELEEFAVRILKEIRYYGLSEVEFMYDNDDRTYKLLEINARTWGWHTLGAKAGVNFSTLLFRDINNESISTKPFVTNVKWVRLLTDVPIAISEIMKKRLKFGDYLRSMRGNKEFAVYSKQDPLPFIMELLLAPYFWYRRGF